MDQFRELLHFDFFRNGLIVAVLLSIIAGIISPLLVSKKLSYMGEAMGHSGLFNYALAILILGTQSDMTFFLSLILGLFVSVLLAYFTYKDDLPSDNIIGIFLVIFLSLGILIHQLFLRSVIDLENLLFGSLLFLGRADIIMALVLLVLSICIFVMRYEKWSFFVFDSKSAKFNGINTKLYHFTLVIFIGLCVLCFVKFSGAIVANALLIMPGALGIKLSRSVFQTLVISLSFSVISVVTGLFLSSLYDISPGVIMALTQFLFFASLLLGHKILINKRSTV